MTVHYSMRMTVQVSAKESFENRQELESFLRDHFEDNNGIEIQVAGCSDINCWDDEDKDYSGDEEIQLFWPEEEPLSEWPKDGEPKW